jgi:hypothetical protein
MNISDIILQAYTLIKASLDSKLTPQGYQIVHEQFDDKVFGSRYVIWSNNEDALRLIWDGKESWFVLEVADALPLSLTTAWQDIALVPFDPKKQDENYITTITKEIVDSLSD